MAESKTRIYRETKVDNYSVIHNQVLRRKDLSWKAKGIMCYILSLPNDWIIYLEELMQHSTDQITSFRSGWKELQQAGYVIILSMKKALFYQKINKKKNKSMRTTLNKRNCMKKKL